MSQQEALEGVQLEDLIDASLVHHLQAAQGISPAFTISCAGIRLVYRLMRGKAAMIGELSHLARIAQADQTLQLPVTQTQPGFSISKKLLHCSD
jgi:hypothetical protein